MFDRSVFIIGMTGSGKSSLGKRVAGNLHIPYSDLDRRISEVFQIPVNDPEFIHQNVLPLYRINISRQVGEHIIIDSRGLHSQKSGNHQQERQNQNMRSQFNNYFTELFHFSS